MLKIKYATSKIMGNGELVGKHPDQMHILYFHAGNKIYIYRCSPIERCKSIREKFYLPVLDITEIDHKSKEVTKLTVDGDLFFAHQRSFDKNYMAENLFTLPTNTKEAEDLRESFENLVFNTRFRLKGEEVKEVRDRLLETINSRYAFKRNIQ